MTDTPESADEQPETEAQEQTAKPDPPPDRLSLNPTSRFFDADLLQRGVGIRFKGKERFNVEEDLLPSWRHAKPALDRQIERAIERYEALIQEARGEAR